MIEAILEKAKNREKLSKNELIQLFEIDDDENLKKLYKIASDIRNECSDMIKLTSTIHLTNKCQVQPRCKYCGFAAKTSSIGYYDAFYRSDDEIRDVAICVEKSGIPRISCSGGHGYRGKQAINATKIVKGETSLEILVNVGADLTQDAIDELKKYNVDTICCNLETINEEIFNFVKPGEKLFNRINICKMVSDRGVGLSSGLLIGIGESYEDRVNHLLFLRAFDSLEEIPIMGFNPYVNTPMESYPPCSIEEQLKTIAITRIIYPHIRITVPTPTIGPKNVELPLIAGANNLATVIPEDYPLFVKGVGSPDYGNLDEVISVVEDLGLEVQLHA
ncbi:biotin synthase [Methanobrevibacter olleyae]|uniref:Biotin synthase n=1 Tax=Methanobrevibacter olleyae TaxID=294671 RepID=A0A1I4HY97_METOL|nr:5,10-methenyltetrahydromethanopterin hydrogenase cofactor biosynthesis protein HmdB [Methanobrevibacter olleyae]SFL47024.1 biotin synthase [Methanobrevibacter olleyae]